MKNSLKLSHGVMFYFLWLFQPLVLWGLGTCQLQRSGSLPLDSLWVRFCFWVAAIYVVLIGPIIHFAYPDIKKIRIKVLRELALFGFLALPLLSFGYYVSHVSHTGALFDLIFPTLSLIFISVHLFEETQNLSLLSIGLSTCLYLQWFGISDILGPFQTAYQMIPSSDFFYWAKVSLIVFTISFVLWRTKPDARTSNPTAVINRTLTMVIWMFVGMGLYFAIPWAVSFYEQGSSLTFSLFDFIFCLIPFYVWVEATPKFSTARWVLFFRGGLIALFLVRALSIIFFEQATFMNVSWVAFDLMTSFLLVLRFDSMNQSREGRRFSQVV